MVATMHAVLCAAAPGAAPGSIFCGSGTGRVGNFFLEGPARSAADQRHSLSRSALEVVIEARVDGDAANRLYQGINNTKVQ